MRSMSMRGAFPLTGLLVSLAACKVGPDYEPPEVDSPDAWRVDYEAAADVSNTDWWSLFGDPVLDDLVDIALRENKDVRIAAARIDEFAARVDLARSGLYPQVGYDGQAIRQQISAEEYGSAVPGSRTFNDYSAGVGLNWEIDLWGKIRRATEAGRAELLLQEENRRTVILSLVSAVATSYVRLRQLDRQLEVANETLTTRAESLRLFELKFGGGVISELEVAQVRSEYEEAAASIPPIELETAFTENAISLLLGRNPGSIARGKTIDELVLPPVPGGVPSTLLTRRPDIRAAEQALIAANARIGVARARYFPTISLTGFLGYASTELHDVLHGGSAREWSLGTDVFGPIFAGGQLSANLRASEAVQRQSLVEYLRTVQTAFLEVEDSLVDVQKSRERLVAEARHVEALSEYARLARLRYDEGYASYVEVLDAQRSLFDVELEYVGTQGDVYASLVSTYKAMGGGWITEAQAVADEVDFPPSPPEDSPFDFPVPTRPTTVGADPDAGAR